METKNGVGHERRRDEWAEKRGKVKEKKGREFKAAGPMAAKAKATSLSF